VDDLLILIVVAGNVKIDNQKYKATFHQKSKMIPGELVEDNVGYDPGGVCPFAVKPDVTIYLDVFLKCNDVVYPGAGSGNNIIELSIKELEHHLAFKDWVDVCKGV